MKRLSTLLHRLYVADPCWVELINGLNMLPWCLLSLKEGGLMGSRMLAPLMSLVPAWWWTTFFGLTVIGSLLGLFTNLSWLRRVALVFGVGFNVTVVSIAILDLWANPSPVLWTSLWLSLACVWAYIRIESKLTP